MFSQVRYEARKVHDLFFDILKFTFPDMDFQGPRIALSFAAPTSVSSLTSPRQLVGSSSRRHKLINEVEYDSSPSPKRMHRGIIPSGESTRISVHLPPKDSRTGTASISAREQIQQDDSLVLTHPGELVVCKKRRNDRDKSSGKSRGGSAGPVSPPSSGPAMRSPGPSSGSKDSRLSQQPAQGSGGSAGWANPVKRSRSGSGKRRRDLQ